MIPVKTDHKSHPILISVLSLTVFLIMLSACQKLNPEQVLRLATHEVTDITFNSAMLGVSVADDGGLTITSKGICWDILPNPNTSGLSITAEGGEGELSFLVTNLEAETSYYVRAFATTETDTIYANEVVFITAAIECPATVTDYAGNVYPVVKIGNQCWMQKNLAVTTLNDGTPIVKIESNQSWSEASFPAYCYYNNTAAFNNTFGALYNGYVLENQHLCPDGWHIPLDEDWTKLIEYLGGYDFAGGKLKEEGYEHWLSPNEGATNESDFTALPGGYRSHWDGEFYNMGEAGYFWTYPSRVIDLRYETRTILVPDWNNLESGYSVRCVKDD